MELNTLTVRYGSLQETDNFMSNLINVTISEMVVVRTNRGTELGEVIHLDHYTLEENPHCVGQVLRKATREDLREHHSIQEQKVPQEKEFFRQKVAEHKLPMKLVDVEHLLGGEKIIFYFVADGRVDFRELVKDLAKKYQTRIELKQIGVRDEAKLLAEYGHCGQRLCCKTFMRELQPVTMKMAKNQKATLDPTKISGICGRLMCCLRFEDALYCQLKAKLPKRGSRVKTAQLEGKVIDFDILPQNVIIQTDDNRIFSVNICEIETVKGKKSTKNEDDNDD